MLNPSQLNNFRDVELRDFDPPFKTIESITEADCNLVRNKIVLFGYLGQDDEDKYFVAEGKKLPSTVILANIINGLLADN